MSFVSDQKIFDPEAKYEYIKTLRAQLSDFEQLLLYYNAIAWFEDEWKLFFVQYRLIKNLPIGLADFYISPQEYFKEAVADANAKGKPLFTGKVNSSIPA